MEKIYQILKNFSFSEVESQLYEASLKLGKASVSQIAQKAGMGRTAAYFHIKNLLLRNVLKQSKSGKKILITPIKPSELAERLQNEVGDFKTILPQLESLGKIESELPQIEIQESSVAFRKIYDEVIHMPSGSSWKVIEDQFGAQAELKLLDNEYWSYFFGQMNERKILTKAIFTKGLLSDVKKSVTPQNFDVLKGRKWDIRTIDEEKLPMKGLVVLYNKKLSFLLPDVALTITIKHAGIFHLVDMLFEGLFSFAEQAENPWEKFVGANKEMSDKQKPQKATEEEIYY
jgi:hypothetical protein